MTPDEAEGNCAELPRPYSCQTAKRLRIAIRHEAKKSQLYVALHQVRTRNT